LFQNYEFTQKDVEDLANALARVALTERQRSLLLAIFMAARDHVVRIPPQGSEGPGATGDGLVEQLINAFIPGETDEKEANLLLQPLIIGRVSPSGIKPPPHEKLP
jgi:hypothetical protein